jgi:hypothetical protein
VTVLSHSALPQGASLTGISVAIVTTAFVVLDCVVDGRSRTEAVIADFWLSTGCVF